MDLLWWSWSWVDQVPAALFVMILVFLLLLVRHILPFAGLLLSSRGPVLFVGSSCLLSLLPCDVVDLLLCCWLCHLCRSLPACLLLGSCCWGLFIDVCWLLVLLACLISQACLRPCAEVSLLLCCWVCHLCRVPACFLLAFEVVICLLLLAVLVHFLFTSSLLDGCVGALLSAIILLCSCLLLAFKIDFNLLLCCWLLVMMVHCLLASSVAAIGWAIAANLGYGSFG